MKTTISKTDKVATCALAGALGIAAFGLGGVAYSENLNTYASEGIVSTDDTSKSSSDYEKTQVVYAKENVQNEISGVYVVNNFSSASNKTLTDKGNYSNVVNLTESGNINQSTNNCSFTTDKAGKFMYQGDLSSSTQLPWQMSVTYTLDGEEIDPVELAGKSGSLAMKIKIEPTNKDDAMKNYSDNYLVQASAKLDNSICANIVAQDATSAQSAGETQLTYMIFPGKTGEFEITANVSNFEFDGWSVVCVPLSIALEVDDNEFDEATNELSELKKAIAEINNGASKLTTGSSNVLSGLSTLSSKSETLLQGANSFSDALESAEDGASSLNSAVSNQLALGSQQLETGCTQYVNTLESKADELLSETAGKTIDDLKAQYAEELQDYMQIYTATYTQIYTALIMQGEDPDVAAQNAASQAVQDENVQVSLSSVNEEVQTLAELSGNLSGAQALSEAASNHSQINEGAKSLSEGVTSLLDGSKSLSSGMSQLDSAYGNLSSGIDSYTSGADELASNYPNLDDGISALNSGTQQLENETFNIDSKMISEVKTKLQDYLNPTFTLADFVNGNTDNIKRVQFVYMTDAIEIQEETSNGAAAETEENTNFLEKLIALFSGK